MPKQGDALLTGGARFSERIRYETYGCVFGLLWWSVVMVMKALFLDCIIRLVYDDLSRPGVATRPLISHEQYSVHQCHVHFLQSRQFSHIIFLFYTAPLARNMKVPWDIGGRISYTVSLCVKSLFLTTDVVKNTDSTMENTLYHKYATYFVVFIQQVRLLS